MAAEAGGTQIQIFAVSTTLELEDLAAPLHFAATKIQALIRGVQTRAFVRDLRQFLQDLQQVGLRPVES